MPGLGTWILVGTLLIFIGIFVIMAATIYEAARQSQQQGQQGGVQAGGVIMIGPIPIIFGTSWRMAVIAMVLAIVLIVIALAFMLLMRPPSPSSSSLAQVVEVLRQLLVVNE